jgi:hypothetical protein
MTQLTTKHYHSLWPEIFDQMANGRSLASILRQDGMPSYSWAKNQIRDDPEVTQGYVQALRDRGDRLAEEIVDLAFTPMPEYMDGKSKMAWIMHLRVKIDALRWTASKLQPKVYGERIDVSVTNTQISITQALEAANKRLLTIDG